MFEENPSLHSTSIELFDPFSSFWAFWYCKKRLFVKQNARRKFKPKSSSASLNWNWDAVQFRLSSANSGMCTWWISTHPRTLHNTRNPAEPERFVEHALLPHTPSSPPSPFLLLHPPHSPLLPARFSGQSSLLGFFRLASLTPSLMFSMHCLYLQRNFAEAEINQRRGS